MRGLQTGLEHTLEFLQAVCPVFDDCDLLLALGSGEVPAPFHSIRSTENKSASSTELASSFSSSYWLATTLVYLITWLCYTTTTSSNFDLTRPSTPPQLPAPLAPCTSSRTQSHTLNEYIPTRAYGRSYIRLSPDLTTRAYGTPKAGLTTTTTTTTTTSLSSSCSGQLAWPADWEPEHFGEHRMLTGSYCAKAEVGILMDRVVDILGRRDLPGVMRNGPHSRGGGSSSVTVAWGSAPQYSPVASGSGSGSTSTKENRQVQALMNALENKKRLNAMVFEMAGYAC
jgi:hypothetical protein